MKQNTEFKLQKVKPFIFDSKNIYELNVKLLLEIVNTNFISLKFDLQEYDFLKHFVSLGFETILIDQILQINYNNSFLTIKYINLNDKIYISNFKYENYEIELLPSGYILYRYSNKKIQHRLIESYSKYHYSTEYVNDIKVEYISHIEHYFKDTRKSQFEDFELYSIIEYPNTINDLEFSAYTPIYYSAKTGKVINVAKIVTDNFNNPDKDLLFLGYNLLDKYNLIDLNNIFTKEELELLKIIVF